MLFCFLLLILNKQTKKHIFDFSYYINQCTLYWVRVCLVLWNCESWGGEVMLYRKILNLSPLLICVRCILFQTIMENWVQICACVHGLQPSTRRWQPWFRACVQSMLYTKKKNLRALCACMWSHVNLCASLSWNQGDPCAPMASLRHVSLRPVQLGVSFLKHPV